MGIIEGTVYVQIAGACDDINDANVRMVSGVETSDSKRDQEERRSLERNHELCAMGMIDMG